MATEFLKTGELKLGDIVEAFEGAFGTAIVCKISPDSVHFFRPYGTNTDFSASGGEPNSMEIITYVGIENFSRPVTDKGLWKVFRRQDIR